MTNASKEAYVALLRGINVGGKNKLPMADLAELCREAGCEDVKTYIQSGNVVFRAAREVAQALPERLSKAIADRFGYTVPVVVRSREALAATIAANPFPEAVEAPTTLHVLFLAAEPDAERVAALDEGRSPPDRFVVKGGAIYMHLPNGAADTKLTNAYFDRALGTVSTGRNWRTVLKLLEMTSPIQ